MAYFILLKKSSSYHYHYSTRTIQYLQWFEEAFSHDIPCSKGKCDHLTRYLYRTYIYHVICHLTLITLQPQLQRFRTS